MRIPQLQFLIFVSFLLFCFSSLWAVDILTPNEIRERLLSKSNKPDIPSFEGVITRISDSESVWVHISSKPLFRKWTYKLSRASLNLERREIKVWLDYVSPARSISKGKKYNAWFKKKVAYEMARAFQNKKVRVDYKIISHAYRMKGVVWSADQAVNLWLVENGWSFYLLPHDSKDRRYHNEFISAEQKAKKQKIGLWKEGK